MAGGLRLIRLVSRLHHQAADNVKKTVPADPVVPS